MSIKQLPPSHDGIHSDAPEGSQTRRTALLGLFGTSALLGLASCVEATTEGSAVDLGETTSAATGTTIGWADRIGTIASPLDLRTMTQGQYSIVIAKGFHVPGDGGGGEFHWTTDTSTPDDGGTVIVNSDVILDLIPRTGCWKRLAGCSSTAVSSSSSIGPLLNVKWFGAKGDGINNDVNAIQMAVDKCGLAGGGIVFFPPGRYKTLAQIVVQKNGVVLMGTGHSSVIAPVGGFNTVAFGAADTSYIYGCGLFDLLFEESGKTSGLLLSAVRVAKFTASRVRGESGVNGLLFNMFNIIRLSEVTIISYRGGFGTANLRLTNISEAGDVAWIRDSLFSTNGRVLPTDPPLNSMKGIDIDGHVHTVNLARVGVGNAGAEAIHIRNSVGSAEFPKFITAYDLELEFSHKECLRLDKGEKCSFASSLIHGSYTADNVVVGTTCRNIDFAGGSSTGANRSGMAIDGRNISVSGMRFSTNNMGGGAYPGILLQGSCKGVTVTGCRSGESDPASSTNPGTQRYGLQVDTGAKGFNITGNTFLNNQFTGVIFGGSNSDFVYANNIGVPTFLNPQPTNHVNANNVNANYLA
ncbi:MAG: hypothetical protein JWP01_2307 [Myxococcales bacterium]|nr:hypothetical protein [Myxococcales bacterium]